MQTKISSFSRPCFTLHETRAVHQPLVSMALPSSPSPFKHLLCKSTFPLAASLTLLLSPCIGNPQSSTHSILYVCIIDHSLYIFGSCSAEAGLMSGSPGIESVPGPELPKLEFLERFNGTNLSNS